MEISSAQINTISGREKKHNGSVMQPPKKNDKETDSPKISGLLYGVKETPPFWIAFFSALQVVFGTLSGALSTSFLIYLNVCAAPNAEILATLISTSLFFVGVTTFLQVTFGLRLPLIQGSSQVFLIPILVMMQSPKWRCPTSSAGVNSSSYINATGDLRDAEPWKPRMAEISGSLVAASITQVLLGATGLSSVVLGFIGPLTVTPLLAIIAVSLAQVVVITSKHQWGIALLGAFLTIFFNVVLAKVQVPCLTWKRKTGFHIVKIQLFRIFSNIFAICFCWILCYILTVTNVFPDDPQSASYRARTDVKLDALSQAPWVFFPYPGQWGPITMSATATVGLLAAVFASVVESLGDYKVTAIACKVPPPPKHAMNRAVMMEGIGSMLSGAFGACHATTTYSQIMGYINYTGVASRMVYQIAALIYIISGVIGKFGGILAIVPDPIVGAMQLISCAMVFSSAIAALENVKLQLPRNMLVLGTAVMIGVSIPLYTSQTPQALEMDQSGILEVLLTNGPLLAGMTGFLLDNFLPGSRKDRGLAISYLEENTEENTEDRNKTEGYTVYEFNFPCCKNISWPKAFRLIPISPLYDTGAISNVCKSKKQPKAVSIKM